MKIIIENSISKIENATIAQLSSIKKILKYEIPGSNFSVFGKRFKSLVDKHGKFPTGLLYLVKKWSIDNKQDIILDDRRIRPKSKLGLDPKLAFEPYKVQEEAAIKAGHRNRGIICAPTGTGKSIMIALTISRLNARSIVVVPTLELKRQLTITLQEIFGIANCGALKQQLPIAIENVDALPTNSDKLYKNYDCVIIDEFHHAAANTYRKLNEKVWNGIFFRIGFTATPFRTQDTEKLLLESVLSEIIYSVSYQQAVKDGLITPLEAFYFDLPKQKGSTSRENYQSVYSRLVVNNDVRNQLICKILDNLSSQKQSALCLVKEIKHGEIIAKATNLHFIKGENDDNALALKIFNKGGHVVIGTTGVIGEGVDTKPCEWVIIAGLGKAKTAIMQQVGRGFRRFPDKETCKVILFRDPSHKWTLNHFKEQCKILKEQYGIVPIKLNAEDIR